MVIFKHRWRLKQQTNGNAITVDGQKPTLDNSIERDRMDPGRDPAAGLFSGLIVVGTVKIWCTKRSGPFRYYYTVSNSCI